MNGPEKNVLRLALMLLVVGVTIRFLPWGLPSIETFQVGDDLIVSTEGTIAAPSGAKESLAAKEEISDKITDLGAGEKARNPSKKKAKKVQLPISINSASVEDLCALSGIGPKLAAKIIATREALGPFKKGGDLKKVPGIGDKKLEKLLPGLIFD